jgi:outer membrane protein assembly factor BamA
VFLTALLPQVDVGSDSTSDSVNINLNVQEKGAHTVSTSTSVIGGEGCVELAWVCRNILGGAEQIRSTVLVGHEQSNALKLDLVKPYAFDSHKLHLRLFHSSAGFAKHPVMHTNVKSIYCRFKIISKNLEHLLLYSSIAPKL